LGLGVGGRGNYVGTCGKKKNVIEGKGFGYGKMNHRLLGDSPSLWVNLYSREGAVIQANGG
jgi:hypothetical protein